MKIKKGGLMSVISAIALAVALTLGLWLGVATARGDEGADEAPITSTKMDEGSTTPPSKSPSARPTPERPAPGSGEDVREGAIVCAPEGGGSIALYTTPWTFDWVFDEDLWQWVETPKEFGETVVSSWPATEEECPAPEPSPEPTPTPTEEPEPEPGDLPVTSDLRVTCLDNGARISLENTTTAWRSYTIVGWIDTDGVEHPLNYETHVQPGEAGYVATDSVPKGTEVRYLTTWWTDTARIQSAPGAILCGSAGGESPSPSPTPTPTKPVEPSPTPTDPPVKPSPSPSPTETVKPTEPPTGQPTTEPSTPVPTPTKEPTKPVEPSPTPTDPPVKPSPSPSPTETVKPTPPPVNPTPTPTKESTKPNTGTKKPKLPKSGVAEASRAVTTPIAIAGITGALLAGVVAVAAFRARRTS